MSKVTPNQFDNFSQNLDLERLNFALDAAGIGTWDLQITEPKQLVWDYRCKQLFGLSNDVDITFDAAFLLIHEDDRKLVEEAINLALNPSNGGNYDVRFRVLGIDDEVLRLVRFIGGAYFDSTGIPFKMTGVAIDVTSEMNAQAAQQAQSDSEDKFKNVTNASPTGLWLSDTLGNITYLNKRLIDWTGVPYEELLGTGWANSVFDKDRDLAAKTFIEAVTNRAHYEQEFRIGKSDGEVIWCKTVGDPYYLEDGTYGGYSGFCMDINERVRILSSLEESEERVRSIVDQAPVAIGVLRGRDFLIESGNSKILEIWGKNKSVLGITLIEALPELKGQSFIELLENVFDSGEAYYGYETLAKIEQNGILNEVYFDFVYAPLKNSDGIINGILVIATEVTQQVIASKLLEESEMRFRGIVEEAPVATTVYTGRELKIEIANEAMLKLWGRDEKVIGMNLPDAIPELEGQPFFKIFEEVFNTKKTYHTNEAKADLLIDGKLQSFYFNFTYKPLLDSQGEVYAILNMAIDITEQVKNRNKIAEAEAKLRIAIETANLGTWEINPKTKTFIASKRVNEWFGIEESDEPSLLGVSRSTALDDKLSIAVNEAISGVSNGEIDVEYAITNQITNQKYTLHTVGQTFYDENGQPYLLSGSTRDITLHRNTEMELENLVQKRTEELQVINEELETTNEELAETNDNLYRSNEELEQYAYVASHDLQEPLRKIRVFSDMLSQSSTLSSENRKITDKINKAAARMSLLIKDLLEFSRLLKVNKEMEVFDLSAVIKDVITDFELTISEKNALININFDSLKIECIHLQINQLFYNLLNNALKFTDPSRIPNISFHCEKMSLSEIKKFIPRHQETDYYKISIQDNGIGFDEQFTDQIFEVFKRLHGKETYAGSGIGLALCKRIVLNHNGLIYVNSEIGKGSVFNIILPGRQF
jgi:PAS domain S-box-containing protein